MKKFIIAGLTAAMFSTAALAEVTGYTPAVSGEAATAAAINANFDALIASINENSARLDALESYDISGKSYNYKEIAFINAAETYGNINTSPGGDTSPRGGGFARVGILTVNGTLSFNADMTLDVTIREREVEMFVNPISDIGLVESGTFSETGTWSQTGSTVTATFPDGFTLELQVSKGANAITAMIENVTELEDTNSDDLGTYRLFNTEAALAVGVLVEED